MTNNKRLTPEEKKHCEHWPWQWNEDSTECECGRYVNINYDNNTGGSRLSFDLIPQHKRAR